MGDEIRYFIAGPCAIESVDSFVAFADDLVRLFEEFPQFTLVYKGSFDKANRSLMGSPRGVGLVDGEVAFREIRANHPRLMLTTDVHESWQAPWAAGFVDVLQIPAALGRQTDLLRAAAQTGKIVNVKKPLDQNTDFFAEAETKLAAAGGYWTTYRGSGSRAKPTLDLHEILEMRLETTPFVDLTHTNHGLPSRSRFLAAAVTALGIRNYYAEVHPRPAEAISDRENQLDPQRLRWVLDRVSEC